MLKNTDVYSQIQVSPCSAFQNCSLPPILNTLPLSQAFRTALLITGMETAFILHCIFLLSVSSNTINCETLYLGVRGV